MDDDYTRGRALQRIKGRMCIVSLLGSAAMDAATRGAVGTGTGAEGGVGMYEGRGRQRPEQTQVLVGRSYSGFTSPLGRRAG